MPEKSVEAQASDFASRITRIAKIFGGENTPEFQSDIISGERGWLAEIHNHQHGFNLTTDEEDSFLVRAEWSCSSDTSGQWLKINQSSFAVFLTALPKKPLFRYDFVSDYSARIPEAHIHFHADHPSMQASQALQDAQGSLEHLGSGSQRARRKVKHRRKIEVSDLHFPVGGTRFRPALEDILLMMVEEYGVKPKLMSPDEAVAVLKDSLKDWREAQAKAVIRDVPHLAIEFLESEGFRVVADVERHGSNVDPREFFDSEPHKLLGP